MVEDEPASSSSAPPPPSPRTLPSAVAAAAAASGGGGGIGVPQPSTSPPPRRRVSSYGRYSSTDPLIISRSSIPSPNQWASAFQSGQDQTQNQNQEYGHRHLPTSRTPDLQHQSLERGPPDPTSERSIDEDYAAAAAKRAAKRNSRGGDGAVAGGRARWCGGLLLHKRGNTFESDMTYTTFTVHTPSPKLCMTSPVSRQGCSGVMSEQALRGTQQRYRFAVKEKMPELLPTHLTCGLFDHSSLRWHLLSVFYWIPFLEICTTH